MDRLDTSQYKNHAGQFHIDAETDKRSSKSSNKPKIVNKLTITAKPSSNDLQPKQSEADQEKSIQLKGPITQEYLTKELKGFGIKINEADMKKEWQKIDQNHDNQLNLNEVAHLDSFLELKKSEQDNTMLYENLCKKDPDFKKNFEKVKAQLPPELQAKIAKMNPIYFILAIEAPVSKETDIVNTFKTIIDIVEDCRKIIKPNDTPEENFKKISICIEKYAKGYEVKTFLTEALGGKLKHTDCDTGSFIYICVAYELGLPIRLISAPKHAYVAWINTGKEIYWETTANKLRDKSPDHVTRNIFGFASSSYQNRASNAYLMYENAEKIIKLSGLSLALDETPGPYCLLGFAYAKQKKYIESIESYEMAIRGHPSASSNYEEYANLCQKIGCSEKALMLFEKALTLAPFTMEFNYFKLGDLYSEVGNYVKAIDCYKNGIKHFPKDAGSFNTLGYFYFTSQKYGKAIDCYKKAIQLDPQNDQNLKELSAVYYQLNQLDESKKYYNLAKKINPKCPSYYNSLTSTFNRMRHDEKTIECFQKAQKLNPEDKSSYVVMGSFYRRKNQHKEALTYFMDAPKDAYYSASLGYMYLELKQYEDAIQCFKDSVNASPKARRFYTLGKAYLEAQQYENALNSLEKAITLDPTDGLYFDMMGDVYSKTQNYPEAINQYNQSLILDPKNFEAYRKISEAYTQLNDHEKAKEFETKYSKFK